MVQFLQRNIFAPGNLIVGMRGVLWAVSFSETVTNVDIVSVMGCGDG